MAGRTKSDFKMFAAGAGIFGVGWEALHNFCAATRAQVYRTTGLVMAIACVLGIDQRNIGEFRQALIAYIRDNWMDLAPLDDERRGLDHFVAMANRMATSGLVAEAACRLAGLRVFLRVLGNGRTLMFGNAGPMYEVVFTNGHFVAVASGPAYPWAESGTSDDNLSRGVFGRAHPARQDEILSDAHTPRSPSPVISLAGLGSLSSTEASVSVSAEATLSTPLLRSTEPPTSPQHHHLDEAGQRRSSSGSASSTRPSAGGRSLSRTPPQRGGDSTNGPSPSSTSTARLPRSPPATRRAPLQRHRQHPPHNVRIDDETPRRRRVQRQAPVTRHLHPIPPFRPARLGNLPPQFAAELMQPVAPPYIPRPDGGVTCGLPGCPSPQKLFSTIANWKRHVTLSRDHIRNAFCTHCLHQLVLPVRATPGEIALLMESHKRERCPKAPKKIMRERAHEELRLQVAGRDITHFLIDLPDDDDSDMEDEEMPAAGAVQQGGPANVALREAARSVRPQGMGVTESERRAYVCVGYAKFYKETEPDSYRRVVNELNADLS